VHEVKADIRVVEDAGELRRMAAQEFLDRAGEAVIQNNTFTVALSGGSTPRGLYSLLANPSAPFLERVPWESTHFFWGDERHVPPEHPDSNYRMAYETLLSKVPVPPENVHRIRAENPDPVRVAENYEAELQEFFRYGDSEWPRFDLVLLGMGADGHTASLFPGTEILFEEKLAVSAQWIETYNAHRISLTPPVLNHASGVIFLVSGGEKAGTLRTVFGGEYRP